MSAATPSNRPVRIRLASPRTKPSLKLAWRWLRFGTAVRSSGLRKKAADARHQSGGRPIRKVTLELIEQPLLPVDAGLIELTLAVSFGARQQQPVVPDDLLAAADQEAADVAHGSAPAPSEPAEPFGIANATGKVSAVSASSAVCSSARRRSMNWRSNSETFVRSSRR